jgi:hypothetical protein
MMAYGKVGILGKVPWHVTRILPYGIILVKTEGCAGIEESKNENVRLG